MYRNIWSIGPSTVNLGIIYIYILHYLTKPLHFEQGLIIREYHQSNTNFNIGPYSNYFKINLLVPL